MEILPKTLEEHRDYLCRIVRLKLFFAAKWHRNHPEESVRHILTERVDIFRKLEINPEGLNPIGYYFDTPGWLALETRLAECLKSVRGNPALFEEWGFDILKSQLDQRCVRDFRDRSALAPYQCGFLRHNLTADREKNMLGFHIANDCAPRSFFDDPEHIRACFRKLLDAAEAMEVKKIGTTSWLNSVPRWQALFPPEWKAHLSAPDKDVQWHYAFWGQFINARGCFNDKFGAILRETGEFPYYPCSSWCSIEAMRKHLA